MLFIFWNRAGSLIRALIRSFWPKIKTFERWPRFTMYFIERLTVYSWVFYIFPYFLGKFKLPLRLYYVDATPSGLWLSRLMAKSIKAEIKHLDFTFFNARDRHGEALWWKAWYED